MNYPDVDSFKMEQRKANVVRVKPESSGSRQPAGVNQRGEPPSPGSCLGGDGKRWCFDLVFCAWLSPDPLLLSGDV